MSVPGLRTCFVLGLFALPMAMIGGWAGAWPACWWQGSWRWWWVAPRSATAGGWPCAPSGRGRSGGRGADAPRDGRRPREPARIPAPAIHLSPTLAMNAFVTGVDPVLCVTEGLLARLDEREPVRCSPGRSAGSEPAREWQPVVPPDTARTRTPRRSPAIRVLARALRTLEAGAAALLARRRAARRRGFAHDREPAARAQARAAPLAAAAGGRSGGAAGRAGGSAGCHDPDDRDAEPVGACRPSGVRW